jgi:hypothetical protein
MNYGCMLGKCVQTQCTPPCTNGNSCVGGQCHCNNGPACAPTDTCCGDGCHNLASDPNNCNACGHVCNAGDYCCNGACIRPDNANCTGCGQACKLGDSCCFCPGQMPSCTALACLCPVRPPL